ncbi:hypothetical protein A5844_000712 [Enterococcus sp. 10A9_DIV0425]|uniref:Prevent-host-death protein n=1 Tax=Candidatus Enterococcus wittei TaxID=1987383 RepID=A0A2C9XQQ2_9ENTE|nr:prevent-host-death protein [Enterococcus sp. 10A9_DIV0425]OTP12479.1 hypothetical protein A5844_000712 [Enterococcus sp. 10A9_DIV0425]THE10446.1 type II toxin-antitoxin system Phd/YefM family antitoxin [Enterococcus hirae]
MVLKKLEVPTSSITEVKRSPMDVFDQARKAETGVYIFNREKIAGVMLTQTQYETLLQELETLRHIVKEQEVEQEGTDSFAQDPSAIEATSDELTEIVQQLKQYLVTGVTISAKHIDERMVALGFITKKTGFGGVVDMLTELTETGKINYQLRRKPNGKIVVAEIIGEQDSQSQLFDKVIIKKIYVHEI